MTASPYLETKNIQYVIDTAELVLNSSKDRRAGSVGEEQAQHIFMNELKRILSRIFIYFSFYFQNNTFLFDSTEKMFSAPFL